MTELVEKHFRPFTATEMISKDVVKLYLSSDMKIHLLIHVSNRIPYAPQPEVTVPVQTETLATLPDNHFRKRICYQYGSQSSKYIENVLISNIAE